jgi:single-strand DNA-binding protein
MLQVTAVGNLAADPEVRTVGDNEVANFLILCNKKIKGEEHVSALRCAVWGPRAKVVADYLTKGSQVTVTGQAYVETYETKTGETRANLNVAVNDFTLPPKPRVETADMPF